MKQNSKLKLNRIRFVFLALLLAPKAYAEIVSINLDPPISIPEYCTQAYPSPRSLLQSQTCTGIVQNECSVRIADSKAVTWTAQSKPPLLVRVTCERPLSPSSGSSPSGSNAGDHRPPLHISIPSPTDVHTPSSLRSVSDLMSLDSHPSSSNRSSPGADTPASLSSISREDIHQMRSVSPSDHWVNSIQPISRQSSPANMAAATQPPQIPVGCDVKSMRDFMSKVVASSDPADAANQYGRMKTLIKANLGMAFDFLFLDQSSQERCLQATFADLPALGDLFVASIKVIPAEITQFLAQLKTSHGRIVDPVAIVGGQVDTFLGSPWGTTAVGHMANLVNDSIRKIDVNSAGNIDGLLDPRRGGIAFDDTPHFIVTLVRKIIKNYFVSAPDEIRRKIIAYYLRTQPTDGQAKKLAAVLNGAGPILQKMFQLFATEDGKGPFQEVMNSMKTGIEPMTPDEVMQVVKKHYPDENAANFPFIKGSYHLDKKPLASASIGQAYSARIKDSLETIPVVFKVKRDKIDELARKERETLLRIASEPVDDHEFNEEETEEVRTVRKRKEKARGIELVQNLSASVLSELNLQREGQNLDHAGQIYDDASNKIKVVKNYTADTGTDNTDLLIMGHAEGKPLIDIDNTDVEYQCTKALGLGRLYKKFMYKTLFDHQADGFHGDLHGGNAFLKTDGTVTLIDAGNFPKITPTQKNFMIRMVLGVETNNPELILEGINQASPADLLKKVFSSDKALMERTQRGIAEFLKKFDTEHPGDTTKFTKLLDYLMEVDSVNEKLHINIQPLMVAFSRGRALIRNQLVFLLQKMKEMDTYSQCDGIRTAEEIEKEVFVGNLLNRQQLPATLQMLKPVVAQYANESLVSVSRRIYHSSQVQQALQSQRAQAVKKTLNKAKESKLGQMASKVVYAGASCSWGLFSKIAPKSFVKLANQGQQAMTHFVQQVTTAPEKDKTQDKNKSSKDEVVDSDAELDDIQFDMGGRPHELSHEALRQHTLSLTLNTTPLSQRSVSSSSSHGSNRSQPGLDRQ